MNNPETDHKKRWPALGADHHQIKKAPLWLKVSSYLLSNLFGAYIGKEETQHRNNLSRKKQKHHLGLSTTVLIGLLAFTAILFTMGFIINGSQILPTYAPDPVNYPPYEWMWEK